MLVYCSTCTWLSYYFRQMLDSGTLYVWFVKQFATTNYVNNYRYDSLLEVWKAFLLFFSHMLFSWFFVHCFQHSQIGLSILFFCFSKKLFFFLAANTYIDFHPLSTYQKTMRCCSFCSIRICITFPCYRILSFIRKLGIKIYCLFFREVCH
jgi:hypothetical protein